MYDFYIFRFLVNDKHNSCFIVFFSLVPFNTNYNNAKIRVVLILGYTF